MQTIQVNVTVQVNVTPAVSTPARSTPSTSRIREEDGPVQDDVSMDVDYSPARSENNDPPASIEEVNDELDVIPTTEEHNTPETGGNPALPSNGERNEDDNGGTIEANTENANAETGEGDGAGGNGSNSPARKSKRIEEQPKKKTTTAGQYGNDFQSPKLQSALC